jgi:hypothetical protein
MDVKTIEAPNCPEESRAEPSRPVFIVAAPCSNAAALATSLSASKDFWTSAESHLFYALAGPDADGNSKLYAAFQQASANESFWIPKHQVVYPFFASFVGLGLDQMFLAHSNGRRWVEASSENTLIAADLSYMFPRAKFLNIIRDGRDAVQQMIYNGLEPDTEEGFLAACETWNVYVQRGLEFQEMFAAKVLEVRHEQLVHATETQGRWIMDFLEGSGASELASHLSTLANDFEDRLWRDWDNHRREEFTRVCGQQMNEVGYALDWY